ncbi:MAG TPA: hypothetical protein VGE01_12450 [Fimbriimonas sp.]
MIAKTPDTAESRRLHLEAAQGFRRPLGPDARTALLARFAEAGEEPPNYLVVDTVWVDRPAKLFEAGDYPDKGVSITVDNLGELSEGFDLPVPVLIEHSESPLHLGYLTGVEPRGEELYGTISLTREADALIEQSGARSLSLGLSPDLKSIREVSLVRNPRVESARLFSSVMFSGELGCAPPPPAPLSSESHPGGPPPPAPSSICMQTEEGVRRWVREGRLVPAQVPFVRALLESSDAIEFDGSKRPLRQLVIAMVERQPPHALFCERIPASNGEANDNLLLPEEAEFYRRHFPDVSLNEIARRR